MPGGWSVPCSCPNSPRSQLVRLMTLSSLAGEPKGERDSFLDACFAPRSPLRSKEADSPLGLIIGRLKRAHGSPIRFQKEFGSFSARANRHENGNLHEEAMLASRRQEKERRGDSSWLAVRNLFARNPTGPRRSPRIPVYLRATLSCLPWVWRVLFRRHGTPSRQRDTSNFSVLARWRTLMAVLFFPNAVTYSLIVQSSHRYLPYLFRGTVNGVTRYSFFPRLEKITLQVFSSF